MADTWDATVEAVDILPTYPAAPTGLNFGGDTIVAYYVLVAFDKTNPPRYFYIQVILKTNAAGSGWETVERHGHNNAPASGGTDTFTTTGAEGAFAGGGVLTITKNETGSQYEFSGPLGTSNIPFGTFGATAPGELEPTNLQLFVGTLNEAFALFPFSATHTITSRFRFQNFYGKLNGTNIKGATLASGDRGAWLTATGPLDPFVASGSAGNIASQSDDDSAAAIGVTISAASAFSIPLGQEFEAANAEWDHGFYMDGGSPIAARTALDAVLCRTSGNLYVLRVASTEPTEVFFAVSRDRGATWEEQTLHTLIGGLARWPTLDVDPEGKILAMWQDGNDAARRYWAVSENFGKTWSAASDVVDVSFGGQRARYHPGTGLLYLVYRDTADAEYKVVAYDEVTLASFTPADPWATPRVVVSATADRWPALTFSYRGVVQLQWSESDRLFSVSDSMGVDWTNSSSEPATEKAQPSAWNDEVSGLHYVLSQHPSSGDLSAFASDDGGVTALVAGPSGTVVAAADQQYAAVVADHRGQVYAIYQELSLGSYVIACKKSDSLSADWTAA